MGNSFNFRIIAEVKSCFEMRCITLLISAYNSSITENKYSLDWDENMFSAHLAGHIKCNPLSKEWRIKLVREYYLDDENTYNGITHPNESPRIDFEFSNWSHNEEFQYFVEAKNLSENNWVKSNGANVNANSQIRRYIETGIDNYTSSRYPKGCLVGYVLNGKAENVVGLINNLLKERTREQEYLYCINHTIYNYNNCYISHHQSLDLVHILLKF